MPLPIQCPLCLAPARLLDADGPGAQSYRCDGCGNLWSAPQIPGAVSEDRCPQCGAASLIFVEHTQTNRIVRCTNCGRIIALPRQART